MWLSALNLLLLYADMLFYFGNIFIFYLLVYVLGGDFKQDKTYLNVKSTLQKASDFLKYIMKIFKGFFITYLTEGKCWVPQN